MDQGGIIIDSTRIVSLVTGNLGFTETFPILPTAVKYSIHLLYFIDT